MAPCFEEITFPDQPPTIEEVLVRLNQRTGVQVVCRQQEPGSFAEVYTLSNPEDDGDDIEIFYDQGGQLCLAWVAPTTYLAGAALQTLVAMGGITTQQFQLGLLKSGWK